ELASVDSSCGIDAVIGLSEQLLTTGQMQFLLMYKFSQDHLELFFNAVRRFGGWNNNPSVNHFKAAFRALISRCRAAAVYGSTGNCVAQENVELVRASLQSPSYASPFHEEDVALDVIEDNLSEHFSSELYAILAQNIVTYICGWAVKKILKSTKCDECRFVLCRATAPEPGWSMDHRFRFLHLKNRGGLVCPSAGQPSSSEGAAPCVEQTWQFECV
ncbi:hypothetical protein CAPTEDRAFT_208086, partial [Capitella teleta]